MTNETLKDTIESTIGTYELPIPIEVVRLNNQPLPTYQTKYSAGFDLYASVEEEKIIPSHTGRAVIPTGIKVAIPNGYELQIRPRSGLAAKYGITVCNAPGTIDAKGMM